MDSDFSPPSIDLSHLQKSALYEYEPESHEAVQEIDRQIEVLQDELSDQESADREYVEAISHLKEVKGKKIIGQATEEDVQEAEAAVDEVEAKLSDEDPTEIALEELKEHRQKTLEAVKQAFRDRCQEVYNQLVMKMEDPVRSLLDLRAKAQAIEEAYSRQGDGPSILGGQSMIRSEGPGEELPPIPVTAEDPGNLSMVAELRRWLRKWTDTGS